MDIAKEMTREALPIKCLEAVILGMYLYSSWSCCMTLYMFWYLKVVCLTVCSFLILIESEIKFPWPTFAQLPHQQHAWCGALPPQLSVSVLREPLPPHRAGGPQWGTLWRAGHQPAGGPHVQAPGAPDTDGLGARIWRSLQGLLAHPAQGPDRAVRIPRPSQRGADRMETFDTGRGEAHQGGATKGAGEAHSRYETQGTAQWFLHI